MPPSDAPGSHPLGNDYRKLLALNIPSGEARHVDILHDDWCARWRGGICNCDPEIHLKAHVSAEDN